MRFPSRHAAPNSNTALSRHNSPTAVECRLFLLSCGSWFVLQPHLTFSSFRWSFERQVTGSDSLFCFCGGDYTSVAYIQRTCRSRRRDKRLRWSSAVVARLDKHNLANKFKWKGYLIALLSMSMHRHSSWKLVKINGTDKWHSPATGFRSAAAVFHRHRHWHPMPATTKKKNEHNQKAKKKKTIIREEKLFFLFCCCCCIFFVKKGKRNGEENDDDVLLPPTARPWPCQLQSCNPLHPLQSSSTLWIIGDLLPLFQSGWLSRLFNVSFFFILLFFPCVDWHS